MGATWETIAFILHALGAHDQQNVGYATAHQLLYLLAPLWINAYAYMTFARMVHFFLPEQRIWRVKGVSLAKYFVWADIVSFLVQAVGGLMASPGAGADTIRIGINVYMGGMGLQEAFILVFIGLMIKFHRRGIALDVCGMAPRQYNWRPLLYALYGALVAITVGAPSISGLGLKANSDSQGPHHLPHLRVCWRRQTFESYPVPRGLFIQSRCLPNDGCHASSGHFSSGPLACWP